MKKYLIYIIISFLLISLEPVKAQIPIVNLITGAIKKVIKAIDLQIQRQQNKVILLQNAQKTLENAMAKLKLNEISDWTEKQRKLYDDYFKELWKVKTAITNYKKLKNMILRQEQLISEYGHAWSLIKQDGHFTPQEIQSMSDVYTGIMNESIKNMDQMALVANSFSTQMSDGKRIELIKSASDQQETNLTDLRNFNNHNARLSISRAHDEQETLVLKKLYGVQ